jgi:hypothetical protein
MKRWVVGVAALLVLVGAGPAKAIIVHDVWKNDLNLVTSVQQDNSLQRLLISEEYGEDDLVPYPSHDGFAVVDKDASGGVHWFDKIIEFTEADPVGPWEFHFIVTNTSPFDWSDYHFEIYHWNDFTTRRAGILQDADNGIFTDQLLTSDSVEFWGGTQASGVTNEYVLYVDVPECEPCFGVRQIATTVIPEPASLVVWSLLAALGITVGWRQLRRRGRAGPDLG